MKSSKPKEPAVEVRGERLKLVKEKNDQNLREDVDSGQCLPLQMGNGTPFGGKQPHSKWI